MNCSDDLIKRVEGENYEEGVKRFEIVRVVMMGSFAPLLGINFLKLSYQSLSKALPSTDSANSEL